MSQQGGTLGSSGAAADINMSFERFVRTYWLPLVAVVMAGAYARGLLAGQVPHLALGPPMGILLAGLFVTIFLDRDLGKDDAFEVLLEKHRLKYFRFTAMLALVVCIAVLLMLGATVVLSGGVSFGAVILIAAIMLIGTHWLNSEWSAFGYSDEPPVWMYQLLTPLALAVGFLASLMLGVSWPSAAAFLTLLALQIVLSTRDWSRTAQPIATD